MALPAYNFRPAFSGGEVELRPRSARRARLWAGGTYFRSKETGSKSNNISIQLLEFDGQAKLVVTNHNTLLSENIVGPADAKFLEQNLNWTERYSIEASGDAWLLRHTGISLQIAPVVTELGPFTFSQLLHIPDKLSTMLLPRASEMTPNSVITIKPRVRVYDLAQKMVTIPPAEDTPGFSGSGWDPDALRAAMASDPWIEMPPRPYDEQDSGKDEMFLTSFPDTKLAGGDGLPETPAGISTGPSRALVYLNYSEAANGSLAEASEIYEWVGESATSGNWKRYS